MRFCDEWEKWINSIGKKIALGNGSTKSVFSVLRTREDNEELGTSTSINDEDGDDIPEEFTVNYDSDACSQPMVGERGTWSTKKSTEERVLHGGKTPEDERY